MEPSLGHVLREHASRRFPGLVDAARRWRNIRALNALPSLAIDLGRLPRSSEIAAPASFRDDSIAGEAESVRVAIENASPGCFEAFDGGAGREDARALWYWVRRFRPRSVLEIGTGSGVTTSHMAVALQQCHGVSLPPPRLLTMDIRHRAPVVKEILARLGCAEMVEFVTEPSLSYLGRKGAEEKFDLILLDGDHNAHYVYREIALTLEMLRPGGVFLVHDYYDVRETHGKYYFPIPGPYLAITRLIRENPGLVATAAPTLPWPTWPTAFGGNQATVHAVLTRA